MIILAGSCVLQYSTCLSNALLQVKPIKTRSSRIYFHGVLEICKVTNLPKLDIKLYSSKLIMNLVSCITLDILSGLTTSKLCPSVLSV